MATIIYNRKMFIERVKRHMNNGFPNDEFSMSDNEINLYIDEAVAPQIKAAAYEHAKIDGVLAIPEGFLITYEITDLQQDPITGYWSAELPQPPLSLPLGYSITDAYFANAPMGRGQSIFLIKAKRRPYRFNMARPTGTFAWLENNKIWLEASNGHPLSGSSLFVQMPSSRSTDNNSPMNMPDDVLDAVFNSVTQKLTQRMLQQRDIVKDYLPSGNNNLKS